VVELCSSTRVVDTKLGTSAKVDIMPKIIILHTHVQIIVNICGKLYVEI
jgi:putative transposon-encoded protein